MPGRVAGSVTLRKFCLGFFGGRRKFGRCFLGYFFFLFLSSLCEYPDYNILFFPFLFYLKKNHNSTRFEEDEGRRRRRRKLIYIR